MPTLHVTPDGHENLQVIADALCKARKVVVITGAGISTNSGIPVSLLCSCPSWFAAAALLDKGEDLTWNTAPRISVLRTDCTL